MKKSKTILTSEWQGTAEKMGLRGGWVILREHWNEVTKKYDRTEMSFDGETWEPYQEDVNVVSIRFVGGPKNGRVEM